MTDRICIPMTEKSAFLLEFAINKTVTGISVYDVPGTDMKRVEIRLTCPDNKAWLKAGEQAGFKAGEQAGFKNGLESGRREIFEQLMHSG